MKKQSTTWLGQRRLRLHTYWFREVALQSHTLSLVLTKSSSVLSTHVFSCRSKFTVYCTQNSGPLKSLWIFITCFHVGGVALQAQENRHMTPDPLGACIEGVDWGRASHLASQMILIHAQIVHVLVSLLGLPIDYLQVHGVCWCNVCIINFLPVLIQFSSGLDSTKASARRCYWFTFVFGFNGCYKPITSARSYSNNKKHYCADASVVTDCREPRAHWM